MPEAARLYRENIALKARLDALERRLAVEERAANKPACRWPPRSVEVALQDRNQIGMDVTLEALRLWRERRKKKLDVLLKYARMRHVEQAMRPYLEASP